MKELIENFRNHVRLTRVLATSGKGASHSAFATLQGESPDSETQGDPPKSENSRNKPCLRGQTHRFSYCFYLKPARRPADWKADPAIEKKIAEKIKNFPKIAHAVAQAKKFYDENWKKWRKAKKSNSSTPQQESPSPPSAGSSFYIEQKDSRFTSIRKPNAPWNDSSKHESGRSKSRFKQNTTPSLRWRIFKRNSKKMRSRLIKLFPSSDRFGTLLRKKLVSLRPSSIRRQKLMSRAMWIDESRSWMIQCRCVLCKKIDFVKLAENEKAELSNAILMRNVPETL